MPTPYRQLCRDHQNMQQLLDAFERLLADFTGPERDPATLGIILDALDYVSVYPDRWHHPLEDLAMQRLRDKPGANRAAIDHVLGEHAQIAEATRRMRTLFYAVANDAAVAREQLLRRARDYLQLQRRHMEFENREIFPQFRQLLSESDWEAIGHGLQRLADPLFTPAVKGLYESLHHYVTHQPDTQAPRAIA